MIIGNGLFSFENVICCCYWKKLSDALVITYYYTSLTIQSINYRVAYEVREYFTKQFHSVDS